MNNSIRLVLVLTVGVLGAVYLGILIGQEEFLIPILVGVIGLIVGGFKLVIPGVNPGATCLSFLIFGYMVGNRGFASLGLSIVYVGEVGMLMACMFLLFSGPGKILEAFKGNLGRAVLFVIALGGLRLAYDLIEGIDDPIDTIRDSAISYYALFFPLGYAVAFLPRSHGFMRWSMRFTCVISLSVASVYFFKEDWFHALTFRGIPLIMFKGDLIGMCFAISAIVFGLSALDASRSPTKNIWFGYLFVASVASCAIAQSRAGYLALAGGCLILLFATSFTTMIRRLIPGTVAAACVAMVSILAISTHPAASAILKEHWEGAIQEFETIVAPFDDRSSTESTEIARQNTKFRLEWWKATAAEVYERNLLMGIGFGEPIALARFVDSYELTLDVYEQDAVVRSPHSIAVTYFGRFGIVGAIWFIWFSAAIVSITRKSIKLSRSGALAFSHLIWLGVTWVVFITGLFGVVIEGPMGGIPFWITLGLAYGVLKNSELALAITAVSSSGDKGEADKTAPIPNHSSLRET